jgi:hypothetical protein
MGEASPRAVQPPLRRGPIAIRRTAAIAPAEGAVSVPRAAVERD